MSSIGSRVAAWAQSRPGSAAYLTTEGITTWADYDARADAWAARLVSEGLASGDRVGVLLPDGPEVHAALVGCERAGVIALGIGPRAGYREIAHLLGVAGARALVSERVHQEREVAEFLRAEAGGTLRHLRPEETQSATAPPPRDRALGPDEVSLLNSTSGTTGMPKVVVHDQRRWLAFHELAVRTGALTADDAFMSVVPAPFGFGIWTSHVTPTVLGVPTVLSARFSPEETLELLERHRVTILAAVSTQFVMLLESPSWGRHDLSALRVLYTGGEVVPAARAAEFEEGSGATVLQFYGSNETGAVSGTSLADDRDRRLHSSGRAIPEMQVRLFDDAGNDVTETGRGRPGCRGPTLSRGYWNDDEANAQLVRADGWMMLGDVVTLDADRYLTVVGRTDDFIIRGGKNISGPAVEQEVASHPAVRLAAAVAMPDPVFGERVCVYAELRPGTSLELSELLDHLRARQVSKESWPERLELRDALPRGSGGKIAKQQLREEIRARVAEESAEKERLV